MYGIWRLGGLQSEKLLRYRGLFQTLGSWGRAKKKTKNKGARETTSTESLEKNTVTEVEFSSIFKFEVTGFRYTDWPQARK